MNNINVSIDVDKKDLRDKLDIVDPVPETGSTIVAKINELPANADGIDASHIKNLVQVVGGGGLRSIRAGSNITVDNSDPVNPRVSSTGGSGTPGGSDTQIQFNDGGSFGGDADFTWNKTSNILGLTGDITFSDNSGGARVISVAAPASGNGTELDLYAADGGGVSSTGGAFAMSAGAGRDASFNPSYGAYFNLFGGQSNGNGGSFDIGAGGAALFGGNTDGGLLTIKSGNGYADGNGGNISLEPGNKGLGGVGTPGNVRLRDPGSGIKALLDTSILSSTDKTFTFPDQTGIIVATPDPGANTIYMWDDTDNLPVNVTLGTNLSYDHATHTLNATAGAGTGITRVIISATSSTTGASAALTDYVYLMSGTSTFTLPTAVSNTNRYTVKNVGVNTVTVATTAAQTIDGSSTASMPVANTSLEFISDNSNWNVI